MVRIRPVMRNTDVARRGRAAPPARGPRLACALALLALLAACGVKGPPRPPPAAPPAVDGGLEPGADPATAAGPQRADGGVPDVDPEGS